MLTPSKKLLAILCLLCATSCNSQREAPKPEQPQAQEPQTEEQPVADDTTPKSDTPAATECKNGTQSDDNCMCGKAAIKLADSADWACGNGFWRCMNAKGCKNDGTPYPLGADMTEHGIQCGSRGDIPSLERFACDIDNSAWICIKKDCDCHGTEIKKGDACNANTCLGLTLENSDNLECTSKGWQVVNDGEFNIGGSVHTLTEGTGIGKGVFTCPGNTPGHPKDKIDYELPWANAAQYACEENSDGWQFGRHWICKAESCPCSERPCTLGEACDNGKCVDLARPCKDGNCPCGDGTCMKGAICLDGHCICGEDNGDMVSETSDPDEPKINENDAYWIHDGGNAGRYSELFVSNRYGEFTCTEYFSEGTCYSYNYYPRCKNEKGCRTTDGRHFFYGGSQYEGGNLSFHIDAGFDTVRASGMYGTCVLPRHDGLKRLRDAGDNPKEYICDEKICTCGQEKCFTGQICRLGNCEDDICHIPDEHKTKVFVKDDPSCEEDDYDDDDTETDTDKEMTCEGKWVLGYDIAKCIGGTRYCRGLEDTESKPAPKNPEGYLCLNTDSKHDNAHKAWICREAESCQCGGSPCPQWGICTDEICIVAPEHRTEGTPNSADNNQNDVNQDINADNKQDNPQNENTNDKNIENKDNSGDSTKDAKANPEDSNDASADNKNTENKDNSGDSTKDAKDDSKPNDSKDISSEDNKEASTDKNIENKDSAVDNTKEAKDDSKPEDNEGNNEAKTADNAQKDSQSECNDPSPGKDFVCEYVMAAYGSKPDWVCKSPEGCTCNEIFCPQNASCHKDGIKCGEYLLHDGDPHQYACKTSEKANYEAWKWECTDPKGCTCGNHLCRNYELCENNTCTCNGTLIPGPNYVCEALMAYPAWICKDANSCSCPGEGDRYSGSPCYPEKPENTVVRNDAYYCGDTPLPKDYTTFICNAEHQLICNAPSCLCKAQKTASICPQYALCDKGKCLHPETKQPFTPDKYGYYTEGLMRLCMKEQCLCDQATCNHGEYCILGKCEDPVVVYNNHHYFVGLYNSSDECPSNDDLPENEYPEWDEAYLSYYFNIQETSRPVCSSFDFDYDETRICALPDGCTCGKDICPYGSRCSADTCVYDENARDGQPLDDDNNITCKRTTIKPPHKDFKCDALGWTCKGTDCPCGDATCKTNEVCIAPGTCAAIIQ